MLNQESAALKKLECIGKDSPNLYQTLSPALSGLPRLRPVLAAAHRSAFSTGFLPL